MKKKYSRYQFLKTIGFTGPALMAVLSSCTQNEDFNVDSLVVNSNGDPVKDLGTTTPQANPANGSTPVSPITPSTPVAPVSPSNVLAKIDLTSSSATNLKSPGGYIIVNNSYVVGKTTTGLYVAASIVCSHEPKRQIMLNKSEFYCTKHGARFNVDGKPLNTITRNNLTIYATKLEGNILSIY